MRIIAFVIFLLCLTGCSKEPVSFQSKPNILFLLSDDHSFPYLGAYGYPSVKTPHLDQLASEGAIFNHAYTNAPQCVPSRATLLTGRNVLENQMLRFSASLSKDSVTFPELLREAGYYTGICGRYYHLDGPGSRFPETNKVFEELELRTFDQRVDYINRGRGPQVLEQAKEFLDQVPRGKPFFLWAGYLDPHRAFDASKNEPDPQSITVPNRFPDTPLVRKDLAGYLGEVNRLDSHIGQLLDELKKRNLYENTLIVFMGDNGASLLRGKGTLYDTGVHVPLIARHPKLVKPGTVSNILVSGIDLAPTILDLAGVPTSHRMTGKSFKHALKGIEKENHQYVFSVRGSHSMSLPGNSIAFDLSRTVFNKEIKLIYNPLYHLPYLPMDFVEDRMWKELVELEKSGSLAERFSRSTMFTSERPMFEVYDLKKDPDEFINLAGEQPYQEIEYILKTQLNRWMIQYRDVVPLPFTPNAPRQ